MERGKTLPFHPGELEIYALGFLNGDELENDFFQAFDRMFTADNQQHTIQDQIITYINRFYSEPLTLQHMAHIFHMNQAYLGQLIKKSTGLTFHALLNQIRLQKATNILQTNPDVPIKDLAASLGFSDAYYFTRVFKQHFGVSPREYRYAKSNDDRLQ